MVGDGVGGIGVCGAFVICDGGDWRIGVLERGASSISMFIDCCCCGDGIASSGGNTEGTLDGNRD